MSASFPGLGFDPAPGDLGSVERLAATVSGVQADIAGTVADLRGIGEVGGVWQGRAAAAFADSVEAVPDYLVRADSSTDTAARALQRWAQELAELQDRARRLESRAQEARASLASARAGLAALPTRLPDDRADDEAARDDLARRTDAARAAVAAHGDELDAVVREATLVLESHRGRASDVARAVRAAADDAPPEPGWLDRVGEALAGIGDAIASVASDVWAYVQEHADFVAALGDLFADIAGVLGLLSIFFPALTPFAIGFAGLALVTHGVAMAAGADVSVTTLVLDALGVVTGVGALAGRAINATGRATMAGARWWQVGTKLDGLVMRATGAVVGATSTAAGTGGTVTGWALNTATDGASVGDVPVLGPVVRMVRHTQTPDTDATSAASVTAAGAAFVAGTRVPVPTRRDTVLAA